MVTVTADTKFISAFEGLSAPPQCLEAFQRLLLMG